MAGIYIEGMEMPKGKDALTLAITSDGEVLFVEFDRTIDGGIILSHADIHPVKAIEVPNHGRLIDADALCDLCNNSKLKCVDANDIMRMPTIIPADKEVREVEIR